MKGKTPLESELKYGLDAVAYRRLVRRFADGRRIEQTNVYFEDTATLALRRSGCGIRIRFAPGKPPVLTLKCPSRRTRRAAPRSLKIREEHEVDLPLRRARAVAAGKKPFASLDVPPVRLLRARIGPDALQRVAPIGRMRTRRIAAPWQNGLVLEIDRFVIFGETFRELEIETTRPRETDRAVRVLFRELGIPYRPVSISKLGRFLRAWRARRRNARAPR